MISAMQTEPLGLHHVFERAEAVFADREVTGREPGGVRGLDYAELFAGARGLAEDLEGLGLRPGDRVATYAWNTLDHMRAYIAIPGAGMVMHTVNIRLGADEVAYTLAHAGDRAVLVDGSLWESWSAVDLPDTVEHVLVMGEAPELPAVQGGAAVHRLETRPVPERRGWWRPRDENEAVGICYTSGTTGRPKAVVYSHRSVYLHALTLCGTDAFAIGHHDVVLPVVPMFHANAWNLPYAGLVAGAGLAFPGRHLDPLGLTGFIRDSRSTFAAGVPTVWAAVVRALHEGRAPGDALATVDRIVIGGSSAPESLLDALTGLGIRPVHAWGMTECSPVGLVASEPCTPDGAVRSAARRTQGRPLPGLAVRSSAEGREAARDGAAVGELEISGPFVVDHYHAPEKDDSASFTASPDGRRWLRTGDMVTVDARGYVTLVDRAKDMVKSGGEWISSVDLENRLAAHPRVNETAVIAVPDEVWGERPVAVLSSTDGEPIDPDELRSFLRAQVPRWQLPDRFVVVDEVPKTGVGKFDKKRMRAEYGHGR
jgi:fatty-acyl-CoA synthase